jgi:hypothetical protein
MSEIVKYTHHGREVSVQSHLIGRHAEHCLCWQNCAKFKPDDPDNNCPTANFLFAFCKLQDMVTPVWECPNYEEEHFMTEEALRSIKDDRPYSERDDVGF